jgi:hypothetical protein
MVVYCLATGSLSSEFELWKASQPEDVQRELIQYQEQLRQGLREKWVAQLRIALSLYGIREIMRRHAGSRVRAPEFLEFLRCCFPCPQEMKKRNDMLYRIAKMAGSQKVERVPFSDLPFSDLPFSDLPFLWSLVDNPPTHPRISWNYLVTTLPLLLTQYRKFCPTTGEPMYDEVRDALNEKRIWVSCRISYGAAAAA